MRPFFILCILLLGLYLVMLAECQDMQSPNHYEPFIQTLTEIPGNLFKIILDKIGLSSNIPRFTHVSFDKLKFRYSDSRKHMPKQCGISYHDTTRHNYIIGGQKVKPGQFPWMVIIAYDYDHKTKKLLIPFVRCSASIIHSRYVLTAVHCVQEKQPFGVRMGVNDISSDTICNEKTNVCLPAQDRYVDSVYPHPLFNKRAWFSDDLALLKLDRKVTFTEFIQPICLPDYATYSYIKEGHRSLVAGWGFESLNPKIQSKKLKYLEKAIKTLEPCRKVFNRFKILNDQLCAGGVPGESSCNGDSGGPLMFQNVEKKYYIIGVVSYGSTNCGDGSPVVYTKVYPFVDWILGFINSDY